MGSPRTSVVNNGVKTILREKVEAQVLGQARGPGVIQGSDKNYGPVAELAKGGLGGSGNTKRLAAGLERRCQMCSGEYVVECQDAGLAGRVQR